MNPKRWKVLLPHAVTPDDSQIFSYVKGLELVEASSYDQLKLELKWAYQRIDELVNIIDQMTKMSDDFAERMEKT